MIEEPFPGSSDDMMNTIAAPRARVAKLEAALKHVQEYMRPNALLEPGPSLREMLDDALDAPGG